MKYLLLHLKVEEVLLEIKIFIIAFGKDDERRM
jgi:hypothetical protein